MEMELDVEMRSGMGTDRTQFWDTCNQPYKADCDDSWIVHRAHETNMIHQPRFQLALSTNSNS